VSDDHLDDEDRSHILRPGAARRRQAAEQPPDAGTGSESPAPPVAHGDEDQPDDDQPDSGESDHELDHDAVALAPSDLHDEDDDRDEATDQGSPSDGEDGDLEDGDLEDGDLEDEAGDVEDGDLEDGELEDGDLEDESAPVVELAGSAGSGGGRRARRRGATLAPVAVDDRADEVVAKSGLTAPFRRLYRGQTSFDFVGRRRTWFTISAVIIIAGLLSLGFRGLNLGIDFKGGTQWQVLAPGVSQTQALDAVEAAGLSQPTVEVLGGRTIAVQDNLNNLGAADQAKVTHEVSEALAKLAHTDLDGVSVDHVGPTWGSQVTDRALLALGVFFIVVGIYISFRFEPKMALAAFIAMVHDLLVTIGVYSLAGFQVTPDTVIAVLTILGYSLYDTVVVFDRVRDNTRGPAMSSGRMTYSEMVNLSMNQTLARSVNTSLVAILPVLSVLVVGAYILGATTLQNYGLALTVGLLSGAYSSIFIASPVLAIMKEREPRYIGIRHRVESRSDRYGVLTPAGAAAMASGMGGASTRPGGGAPRPARGAKNRPASGRGAGSSPAPPATGEGTGEATGEASSSDLEAGDGHGAEGVVVAAAAVAGAEAVTKRSGGASAARRPPAKGRRPNRGKGGKRRR